MNCSRLREGIEAEFVQLALENGAPIDEFETVS